MGSCAAWRLRTRFLELEPQTLLAGILNVTPDSFSDGGLWAEPRVAVEHALRMLHQGAHIIDVGGESTRPSASPITPTHEQSRVLPVIRGILRQAPSAILSIDTYNAETATLALEAGAEIVNDVSGGLWDGGMREVWADSGCGVILMHTRGRPYEWGRQEMLPAEEVVSLVIRELRARAGHALSSGVSREAIMLDPGFGFGKILAENFPLLAGLPKIAALGFPVAAGVSRKAFLRRAVEDPERDESAVPQSAEALRDATIAANTAAVLSGARLLRVHDVPAARHAVAIADSIRASYAPREI